MGKLSFLSCALVALLGGSARAQGDGVGVPPPVRTLSNMKLSGIPQPFQDMVDHSPTLQGQIRKLQNEGWKIGTGSPGGVSVDWQKKTIEVTSLSPILLAEAVSQASEPYGRPTASFKNEPAEFQKQFDRDQKMNGAAAVLNTYVVRSEVLERGGKDPKPPTGLMPTGPSEQAQEERDMEARLAAIAADKSLGKDAKVEAMANLFAKRPTSQDVRPQASISFKSSVGGWPTTESFVVRNDGTEEFSSSGSSDHGAGIFDHAPDAHETAQTTKAIKELANLPEPTAADRTIAPGKPAVTIAYPDATGRPHEMTVNMDYVNRNRDKLGDFEKLAQQVAKTLDPPSKTGGFGSGLDRVAGGKP
jgi:hypothetical protein